MVPNAASKDNLFERIIVDPKIMVGKPVIKGTRIPVTVILNLLAHGYNFDRVVEAYPPLTQEDVRAAVEYAGTVLEKRLIFVPRYDPHAQVAA